MQQYSRNDLFQVIRTFVLRYSPDAATNANDVSLIVNGFEFSILQRQRGNGSVRVEDTLTGQVFVSEGLRDTVCIKGEWLAVILRHVCKLPQPVRSAQEMPMLPMLPAPASKRGLYVV